MYLKIPFAFRVQLKIGPLAYDYEFSYFHYTSRFLDLVTFRQDLRVIHHHQAAKQGKILFDATV